MRSIPIETLEENYGGNYSEIEDVWSQSIDRAQLLLAIDRLSDEEKYLVQLRYANDMSFKEIAVLLDINEETAKKRGYRILKRLRAFYEEGDNNVQHV